MITTVSSPSQFRQQDEFNDAFEGRAVVSRSSSIAIRSIRHADGTQRVCVWRAGGLSRPTGRFA
jgi:hypothetical protein